MSGFPSSARSSGLVSTRLPSERMNSSDAMPAGTLLAMLITWLAQGRPHYVSQDGSIAYISDVGADILKPLFVTGCVITAVSFFLSLVIERWLRHSGRYVYYVNMKDGLKAHATSDWCPRCGGESESSRCWPSFRRSSEVAVSYCSRFLIPNDTPVCTACSCWSSSSALASALSSPSSR